MTDPAPTAHPAMFLRRGNPKPTWMVLAHKLGEWRPLTGKYFRNYSSEHEATDAIIQRLATDADFAKHYHGWCLYPLPLHAGVQNGRHGEPRPE